MKNNSQKFSLDVCKIYLKVFFSNLRSRIAVPVFHNETIVLATGISQTISFSNTESIANSVKSILKSCNEGNKLCSNE